MAGISKVLGDDVSDGIEIRATVQAWMTMRLIVNTDGRSFAKRLGMPMVLSRRAVGIGPPPVPINGYPQQAQWAYG